MAFIYTQGAATSGRPYGQGGPITQLMVPGLIIFNRPFLPVPYFANLVQILPRVSPIG